MGGGPGGPIRRRVDGGGCRGRWKRLRDRG